MYENNGFAEGYAIDRDSGNGNGNCWGGGCGADMALWFLIPLFLFGFGGWGGGFGGGFGGFGGGAGLNGALTRGELCQDMNFQSLENGVRGVQQGLCDGFYAQNTNLLTGFDRLNNNTKYYTKKNSGKNSDKILFDMLNTLKRIVIELFYQANSNECTKICSVIDEISKAIEAQ